MRKYILGILSFLLLVVIFLNCEKEDLPDPDPDPATEWEYSTPNVYPVEDIPNSTIFDEETGINLSFPDGGTGDVSISKILKSPSTPIEGFGIRVEYEGITPINIVLDTTYEDSADVLEYGVFSGIFDDEINSEERWAYVPVDTIIGSMVSFSLMMPRELEDYLFRAGKIIGSYSYWIAKIPKGATLHEQREFASLEANANVANFYTALPASLEPTVEARRKRKPLRVEITKDDIYYSGFWGRGLGKKGRSFEPTVYISTPNAVDIAHETGHYLVHLLVGDEKQVVLENQGSIFSGHGVGDEIGRENLHEDLAYFAEFFLSGSGGSYDLLEPKNLFRNKTPLLVDFPSIEGFAAHLLAQLVRTDPLITDFEHIASDKRNIPVVGLSYGEVFEIISMGATDLKTLRGNIETYLGHQVNKLPTICHRIGWRYFVEGKLVDTGGNPIENATVESIDIVGDEEYKGSVGLLTSDENGDFAIAGEVFPGKSVLRVVLESGEGVDIPIEIDWETPTTEVVNLGDIVVDAKPILVNVPFNEDFATKILSPGGYSGPTITSSLNVNGELYMDKRNVIDLDGHFLNSEMSSIVNLEINVHSTELIEVNFKLDPQLSQTNWTWICGEGSSCSSVTYAYEKPIYAYEELPVDNGDPVLIVDEENGIFRITFDPKIHFANGDNYRKWQIKPSYNFVRTWYFIDDDGNEVEGSTDNSTNYMTDFYLIFDNKVF